MKNCEELLRKTMNVRKAGALDLQLSVVKLVPSIMASKRFSVKI
jgi:hypothetical protein